MKGLKMNATVDDRVLHLHGKDEDVIFPITDLRIEYDETMNGLTEPGHRTENIHIEIGTNIDEFLIDSD